MTPEEYAAAQAYISAQTAAYVAQFGKFFLNPLLTAAEWLALLSLLYPQIQQAREQSAALARTFYDSQRKLQVPKARVNLQLLEHYEFDWFVVNMEPVRQLMQRENATPTAAGHMAAAAVREVENGGRRQIINMVINDPDLATVTELPTGRPGKPSPGKPGTVTSLVRGWARVATGRETCAWCLMLVSRGPVYAKPGNAGLDLSATEAQQSIGLGEDVSEFMTEWHVGCDCKVVPVFRNNNWPGFEAQQIAEGHYITAGRRATAELKANPDKKYYSHKLGRWEPTTDNRETINQLRQMIESGEITTDWAAIKAA